MIADLTKRIELKFWDILIPLLSNSSWLRNILHRAAFVYQDEKMTRFIAAGVIFACAGFASGFLLFSLKILLT